jgi:uncharacterized protein
MVPLLSTRRAEIDELCRRFHVRRLDVFGSAAREHDFTDSSDIDLLVEYEPDHGAPRFSNYLALKEGLEALLGRKVDLVMDGVVRNPYVRANIERWRQPIHGA